MPRHKGMRWAAPVTGGAGPSALGDHGEVGDIGLFGGEMAEVAAPLRKERTCPEALPVLGQGLTLNGAYELLRSSMPRWKALPR